MTRQPSPALLSAPVFSLLWILCGSLSAQQRTERFDEQVAPVLIRRCLHCHSGGDPKGGLDLSSRKTAVAGGDSGPALDIDHASDSLLWERVRDGEMPPKQPLPDEEREVLAEWIRAGAAWGDEPLDPFRMTSEARAGYDWWSLQPLNPTPPPKLPDQLSSQVRNGIDPFVLRRLRESGLRAQPAAGRRDLIRRVTLDLHGLPPTPQQVEAFERDERPDAYERLVDRLLASPQYGVRWGRHWLDLARFGESQGFERDKIRDNAWPYRDWVVDALNSDMPYDEFVRRQIAGDVIHPQDPASTIATGFLVAGPWDEVGQSQQSAAMRAVVRQDELEDLVAVVSQTFLGLTTNCARCHDHKFDPIRQREYYQLSAALSGVWHGSKNISLPQRQDEVERLRAELADRRQRLDAIRRAVWQRLGERPEAPVPLARWSFDQGLKDSIGGMHGTAHGQATVEQGQLRLAGGYVSTEPLPQAIREKTLEAWVRLEDLQQQGGAAISLQRRGGSVFDAIVFGEREPGRWMAGSDGFRRTRPFGGPEESQAQQQFVHVAITYQADGTVTGYRAGQPYGKPYRIDGPAEYGAGQSQILLGLRHEPAGGNRHLRGALEAAQLYDHALTAEQVAASAAGGDAVAELLAEMTDLERAQQSGLQQEIAKLQAELPQARTMSVYCVAPRTPGVGQLLLRGNPATPAGPVVPGGIAAVKGVTADFELPEDASDAARRRELAGWITDPSNPLFSRVIANRLWHYHFGRGLVETPNDFGFQGGLPSHPELLDYLAAELVRRDWSLKSLQRLIVTSAAYRRSSQYDAESAAQDAENRLLWRRSPQRRDAESLRDAILSVAGQLNNEMRGPGFRDFETFTNNTQFYVMKDRVGAEFNRRSLYRTWIRSGRNWFLDVFDCPDPSVKTPKRAVTTTPLQALSLMNNSFVLRMADRFAQRLRHEAGPDRAHQVRRAYLLAYGREPSEEEAREAEKFAATHGLADLCRVIFNSNEFLYVD